MHWARLQEENAPLRAVVNGQLVSVGEDFYDGFLLRELAAQDKEFMEARFIADMLANTPSASVTCCCTNA